jgi:hypothetical protein
VAMMRKGRAPRAALGAIILFFILLSGAVPASAQSATPAPSAPVIDTAELKLWPEYDDPGLLVIFSGQFAEGTKFPLQATFPVPAGARNIQATYQDTSGSLINKPFEVKDGTLTYELPSKGFHLEYYVDRAPSGEERDIPYDFVAPYAISALTVDVQQPARATGFALSPAGASSQAGTDGLTYYTLNRAKLAAGEKLPLDIKYSKADTGLSAPFPAATAPAAASSANPLPYLLIGLGLALLAGVLIYWFARRRGGAASAPASVAPVGKPRPATAGRVPAAARLAPRAQNEAGPVSFCTNCGHPLKAEDRFCSQCGAARRS